MRASRPRSHHSILTAEGNDDSPLPRAGEGLGVRASRATYVIPPSSSITLLPAGEGRLAAESIQGVVQFLGVARRGPGFGPLLRDGLGIEPAELGRTLRIEITALLHGERAALFHGRIVEKGVGLCIQDRLRERRGRGQVARLDLDLAALDARQ